MEYEIEHAHRNVIELESSSTEDDGVDQKISGSKKANTTIRKSFNSRKFLPDFM